MHFEGDRDFTLAPAALFAKLSDAAFLVSCVPDGTVVGQPQRDKAMCTVQPGLSFVRGTLEVTIAVVEAREPADIKLLLSSKGIGSTSDVESVMKIAEVHAGSRVHWTVDVTKLGGLLKMVPSGLIRGAAQKTIEDLWDGIARKL